jgi:hypothetical protein
MKRAAANSRTWSAEEGPTTAVALRWRAAELPGAFLPISDTGVSSHEALNSSWRSEGPRFAVALRPCKLVALPRIVAAIGAKCNQSWDLGQTRSFREFGGLRHVGIMTPGDSIARDEVTLWQSTASVVWQDEHPRHRSLAPPRSNPFVYNPKCKTHGTSFVLDSF